MDLSIPLAGIQKADTAFDSAARSITDTSLGIQLPSIGHPGGGDSVDLSTAVVNLLSSTLSFEANVKVASLEDNLTKNELSVLG
jgi:hypothetical protein